jgi:hypothetical protein
VRPSLSSPTPGELIPPLIDPGAFRSVTDTRRLIDKALNLPSVLHRGRLQLRRVRYEVGVRMTTFVGLVPEETFPRRIDNLYVHWWDWTSVEGIMATLHSLIVQGNEPSFSHFITPRTVIIPQTLTSQRCSAPFRMTMPPR